MKIVFIVAALESLALALWLTLSLYYKQRKVQMTVALVPASPAAKAPVASTRESAHWRFINGWQVPDQSDDRRPMLGAAKSGAGPQSVRRSIARRIHQVRFKEWSQERHD
jgi:hypothetical protein